MGINRLLPDTITLYKFSSIDNYGNSTFASSGTDYPARVRLAKKTITNADGQDIIIDGIIYVAGDLDIDNEDKISFDSKDYTIVDGGIDKPKALSKIHHTKIYVRVEAEENV